MNILSSKYTNSWKRVKEKKFTSFWRSGKMSTLSLSLSLSPSKISLMMSWVAFLQMSWVEKLRWVEKMNSTNNNNNEHSVCCLFACCCWWHFQLNCWWWWWLPLQLLLKTPKTDDGNGKGEGEAAAAADTEQSRAALPNQSRSAIDWIDLRRWLGKSTIGRAGAGAYATVIELQNDEDENSSSSSNDTLSIKTQTDRNTETKG